MRVLETKLTVAELFAGERAHVAARGGKHCMTGGGVPFHCPSETRIEVGLACGYETEFERTAGLSRVDDPSPGQPAVERFGIAMRTAGHNRQAFRRHGAYFEGAHMAVAPF